jgi:hypothetical protein
VILSRVRGILLELRDVYTRRNRKVYRYIIALIDGIVRMLASRTGYGADSQPPC